jgi:hypothetical protein
MPRIARIARALSPVLAFALFPAVAAAADFLPLAVGNFWEYRGVNGSHQVETITGFTAVRGRVVAVKSYAEGVDAGLQNYWLLDTDGSVLLAGFRDQTGSPSWAYEPPIRMLPVPPTLGPQPVQHITIHDVDTDGIVDSFDIRIDVLADSILAVPAGSFHAFGAGQISPLPGPTAAVVARRALDGRALGSFPPSVSDILPTDWYSEGVGVVQYQAADVMQLVAYGRPTPVATSSWGALKRLYR